MDDSLNNRTNINMISRISEVSNGTKEPLKRQGNNQNRSDSEPIASRTRQKMSMKEIVNQPMVIESPTKIGERKKIKIRRSRQPMSEDKEMKKEEIIEERNKGMDYAKEAFKVVTQQESAKNLNFEFKKGPNLNIPGKIRKTEEEQEIPKTISEEVSLGLGSRKSLFSRTPENISGIFSKESNEKAKSLEIDIHQKERRKTMEAMKGILKRLDKLEEEQFDQLLANEQKERDKEKRMEEFRIRTEKFMREIELMCDRTEKNSQTYIRDIQKEWQERNEIIKNLINIGEDLKKELGELKNSMNEEKMKELKETTKSEVVAEVEKLLRCAKSEQEEKIKQIVELQEMKEKNLNENWNKCNFDWMNIIRNMKREIENINPAMGEKMKEWDQQKETQWNQMKQWFKNELDTAVRQRKQDEESIRNEIKNAEIEQANQTKKIKKEIEELIAKNKTEERYKSQGIIEMIREKNEEQIKAMNELRNMQKTKFDDITSNKNEYYSLANKVESMKAVMEEQVRFVAKVQKESKEKNEECTEKVKKMERSAWTTKEDLSSCQMELGELRRALKKSISTVEEVEERCNKNNQESDKKCKELIEEIKRRVENVDVEVMKLNVDKKIKDWINNMFEKITWLNNDIQMKVEGKEISILRLFSQQEGILQEIENLKKEVLNKQNKENTEEKIEDAKREMEENAKTEIEAKIKVMEEGIKRKLELKDKEKNEEISSMRVLMEKIKEKVSKTDTKYIEEKVESIEKSIKEIRKTEIKKESEKIAEEKKNEIIEKIREIKKDIREIKNTRPEKEEESIARIDEEIKEIKESIINKKEEEEKSQLKEQIEECKNEINTIKKEREEDKSIIKNLEEVRRAVESGKDRQEPEIVKSLSKRMDNAESQIRGIKKEVKEMKEEDISRKIRAKVKEEEEINTSKTENKNKKAEEEAKANNRKSKQEEPKEEKEDKQENGKREDREQKNNKNAYQRVYYRRNNNQYYHNYYPRRNYYRNYYSFQKRKYDKYRKNQSRNIFTSVIADNEEDRKIKYEKAMKIAKKINIDLPDYKEWWAMTNEGRFIYMNREVTPEEVIRLRVFKEFTKEMQNFFIRKLNPNLA